MARARQQGADPNTVRAANDNRGGGRTVTVVRLGGQISAPEVDVIDRLLQELSAAAANDNQRPT